MLFARTTALPFRGRDGAWRVEMRPAEGEPVLYRVDYNGYTQLRGGKISRADDGSWRVADIVLSRLNATLQGRIVDNAGAAVGWGARDVERCAQAQRRRRR